MKSSRAVILGAWNASDPLRARCLTSDRSRPMKAMDSSSLRIGAWRVDPALDQISKDGNTVKLERRAMQLLLYLSEHAGQVVSVEELLRLRWWWRGRRRPGNRNSR